MPYRTNANELTKTDSAEVKRWKAIHDRYANLEDKLWKLPADGEPDPIAEIVSREHTHVRCAVSPDGERIVVVGGGRGWRYDRNPLQCTPLGDWPNVKSIRLDDRGTKAAYIADGKLFVRDLAADAKPRRLRLTAHPRGPSLSADGSILAVRDERRVYVFDTTIGELIYSFDPHAGSRENWSVCIHPSGELILTHGYEVPTKLFGQDGLLRELPQSNACCFNRSGTLLASGADSQTFIYRVGTKLADWQLLPNYSFIAGAPVTFSPDDALLLVTARSAKVIELEATRRAFAHKTALRTTMASPASFSSGFFGSRLILPLQSTIRTPTGAHLCGGVIHSLDDGSRLGGIAVTHENKVDKRNRLIGFTRGGLFGCLVGDRLIEPPTPFERPGIIGSVLFDGEQHLEAEDSLLHYEHVERDAYCRDIASRLLPGVDYRALMPLLRGLLHLAPEILRRARELSQQYHRFGPVQVTLAGIRRASEELRALPAFDREQRFERMLEDLRQNPRPPTDTTASDIPSMKEHRRMELERILFGDDN